MIVKITIEAGGVALASESAKFDDVRVGYDNNADDDTTVAWWGLEAEDGTGDFAITQAGTTRLSIAAGGAVSAVSLSLTTDLAVADGGTGASTASGAPMC